MSFQRVANTQQSQYVKKTYYFYLKHVLSCADAKKTDFKRLSNSVMSFLHTSRMTLADVSFLPLINGRNETPVLINSTHLQRWKKRYYNLISPKIQRFPKLLLFLI